MADEGISLVSPDGSIGPVPDEPKVDGSKDTETVAPGKYERALAAEDALDDRLGKIYDKMNPEGDEESKPSEPRVAKKPDRAPDGKFKASEAAESAPATETTGDKTPAKEAEGQALPATSPLPRSWSPSMKEQWDRVPPDAQKIISERETQAHAAISEQGQVLAAYKPLGEVLLQNRDLFQRHRANPVDAVTRLLDVQRKLDQDAPRTIAAIAQRYNVSWDKIASALGVDPQQPPITGTEPPQNGVKDPRVDKVAEQVAKLSQRLSEREVQERNEAAQRDHAEQQEVNVDVNAWGQDKEFFEHVREEMAFQIQHNRAHSLEEAYEAACWQNPEIRKHLEVKLRRDADVAEQERKVKEKAEQAKQVAEAKRLSRMQLDGSQRPSHRAKVNGSWSSDSYLEDVFERASSK